MKYIEYAIDYRKFIKKYFVVNSLIRFGLRLKRDKIRINNFSKKLFLKDYNQIVRKIYYKYIVREGKNVVVVQKTEGIKFKTIEKNEEINILPKIQNRNFLFFLKIGRIEMIRSIEGIMRALDFITKGKYGKDLLYKYAVGLLAEG